MNQRELITYRCGANSSIPQGHGGLAIKGVKPTTMSILRGGSIALYAPVAISLTKSNEMFVLFTSLVTTVSRSTKLGNKSWKLKVDRINSPRQRADPTLRLTGSFLSNQGIVISPVRPSLTTFVNLEIGGHFNATSAQLSRIS